MEKLQGFGPSHSWIQVTQWQEETDCCFLILGSTLEAFFKRRWRWSSFISYPLKNSCGKTAFLSQWCDPKSYGLGSPSHSMRSFVSLWLNQWARGRGVSHWPGMGHVPTTGVNQQGSLHLTCWSESGGVAKDKSRSCYPNGGHLELGVQKQSMFCDRSIFMLLKNFFI